MLALRGHVAAALIAFGYVVVVLLFAPPVRAQSDEEAYQSTIAEAVREFSQAHWEEARALFKQAHAREPNARTLRGMGMAAYELRLYVQAVQELEAALRDTNKPLTDEQRTQVEALISQARRFVGRFRFVLEPPDARAIVDGAPAKFEPGNVLFLDVGSHTIGANAPGYRLVSRKLQVDGGEDQEIKLILQARGAGAAAPLGQPTVEPGPEPDAEPRAEPDAQPAPAGGGDLLATMGYVALVGAGASGIAAAAFWFSGESKYDDLKSGCSPDCTDKQISDSGIETADTLTTMFLASAAVWGSLGMVLLVFADSDQEPDPTAKARVELTPTGVQLRGAF